MASIRPTLFKKTDQTFTNEQKFPLQSVCICGSVLDCDLIGGSMNCDDGKISVHSFSFLKDTMLQCNGLHILKSLWHAIKRSVRYWLRQCTLYSSVRLVVGRWYRIDEYATGLNIHVQKLTFYYTFHFPSSNAGGGKWIGLWEVNSILLKFTM